MEQQLVRRLNRIEDENDKRHEANLVRFNSLEVLGAKLTGEMRIIIALLVANGGLQVLQVIQAHK